MGYSAHLIDSDDETRRHCLDDVAHPLTCHVVTSSFVWLSSIVSLVVVGGCGLRRCGCSPLYLGIGIGRGHRLACARGFSYVCCSKATRPLLIVSKKVRADVLSKNMKETAHLIDGDDEMRCHRLDDVARPLTCQVITSTAIVRACFFGVEIGKGREGDYLPVEQ